MAGTNIRLVSGVPTTVQTDQEVSISSGATTAVVTFPATLQTGSTTPRIAGWIFNSTDANPQFFPVTITARSATGFTATWNFATDSANYKLMYIAPDGWRP